MALQRFWNLPDEARTKLLRIATRHFAESGFERASLNEILAEAGLSKGSYYYYFEDKEDLFATVVESALDALEARVPGPWFEGVTRESFWPAVEKLAARWVESTDSPVELAEASAHFTESLRRSPRFATLLERMRGMHRTLIATGRHLGCVRTDLSEDDLVRLLEAVDAALDGLLRERRTRMTRPQLDAHLRLVLDTFQRLLRSDAPRAGRR